MRLIVVFMLAITSIHTMSKAPRPRQQATQNIGVRTLKFEDTKRQRPILVELWYPTEESGPIDAPIDPVWEHPKEIRNAPIASGKHSLILLSHGHGGDRRDRSWISEHLVKSGYIVASIEHHGNSWRSYNPLISLKFWERARDVSFALSELLTDPSVKENVDGKKIGFVGYSLGGMTGLSLAGARAQNVKQIVKIQQEHHSDIEPELVDKVDFEEAQGSFADPRIKAMVLLSPAAFPYPPEQLKNIKIPTAIVASTGDEILPHEEHGLKVITHTALKKVKLIKSSHYVFLNRVSSVGKELMRKDIQTDEIQQDRETIHKEVGAFITSFFQENLD